MTKPRQTGGRGDDAALALKLFDQVFPAPSWGAWRAWLCAVFGLPMTAAEAEIFRRCTARSTLPTRQCREVWTIAGRRSGKSRMAAFITVYLAACRRYRLAPGETGVVPVISPSRSQSRIIFDYAVAMLRSIPALANLIERETSDTIDLATRTSIQIQSASFRTPRGFSNPGAMDDEIAFWRDDSGANPDSEILRAQRPAMASIPGALLVAISSPYAQRGELFKIYERHYGRDESEILVWQAPTVQMNPLIPQGLIDQATADDPASAAAEWGGMFRADLESLFAREALDAVTIRGRHELAPAPGIAYTAFADPSGGSSDSFTLAIAHRDQAGRPVLDLVRERRPPFSPESVVAEFCKDLRRYNCQTVTGDAYGGEWPREQFKKQGVEYVVSELTRSELFLELLPLANSANLELLDHPRLVGQLAGLERRVGRSGRDTIDHRPGSHDDVANAAGGALVHALRSDAFATLPDDFRECYKAASVRSFNMTACYLFGGGYKPSGDPCCTACRGHRFVLAAAQAHRERHPDEHVYFVTFYKERITGNDFVGRVLVNQWSNAMGI